MALADFTHHQEAAPSLSRTTFSGTMWLRAHLCQELPGIVAQGDQHHP